MKACAKYARLAVIDDTIDRFAEGYDTQIGERGVTISGGQKQRVAIARMLMQNTPIKIFDDSLSAVDMETDAKIRESINKNVRGTTILIAHRITTIMNADQIIVMVKVASCSAARTKRSRRKTASINAFTTHSARLLKPRTGYLPI